MTEAVCARREACGCPAAPPGEPSCREQYHDRFFLVFDTARGEQYAYDPGCFEDRLAAIESLGCDEREEWLLDWDTRTCRIFEKHNAYAHGHGCAPHWLGRWQCAGSTWCGACGDSTAPLGSECVTASCSDDFWIGTKDERCGFFERTHQPLCETGLVCDMADLKCRVGPALGEACPLPGPDDPEWACIPCGEGYCDCGDRACDPYPPTSDETYAGTCRSKLAPGEPCTDHRQCEHRCDYETGTCRPDLPLICDDEALESF